LIGGAVARRLLARGHTVVGLARSDRAAATQNAQGILIARGDLSDPASVANAVGQADAVVHAASPNDQHTAEYDEAATRTILAVLDGSGKRFVYTSGALVYGSTGDFAATEETPLHPIELVRWRVALEQEILGATRRGIHPIVIRPGWVYGHGGGAAMMMYRSARSNGAARHVGDGNNRWSTVHAGDLAELYALAIERAEPATIYNGVSGAPVRLIDISQAASEAAGAKGRTQAWPVEEARQQLGAFADALALDQVVSGELAERALGWRAAAPDILTELRTHEKQAS
jgi:nucleoside-diphosphate-sugar epimerase